MKKLVWLAVAVAGFVAGVSGLSASGKTCHHNCTTSTTTTTPPPTYVFQDEFNGPSGQPDPTKWWRSNSCGANPALASCWNLSNVYQDGAGRLVLRVRAGTMGRPYDGARVQTLGGDWPPSPILASVNAPVHVEASIKFTPGAGLWESLWFTRADATGAGDVELDVQEWRGVAPFEDECHVHVGGANTWGGSITNTGFDGSTGFHTYWMNYYTDHVVFGVDAQTCGSTTLPSHPAEVIRLSNDVGGTPYYGGPPPAANIPGYMYVDYVRAWVLP